MNQDEFNILIEVLWILSSLAGLGLAVWMYRDVGKDAEFAGGDAEVIIATRDRRVERIIMGYFFIALLLGVGNLSYTPPADGTYERWIETPLSVGSRIGLICMNLLLVWRGFANRRDRVHLRDVLRKRIDKHGKSS